MPVADTDMAAKLAELDAYIDSLPTKEGKLITVLHKAQDIIGYLPFDAQHHIARRLGVPSSKVYGVVTFYSFFNIKPKGKYKIACCMGTACFVRGAQAIVDEFKKRLSVETGEATKDMLFSLDTIRCVGACGLAPVISVNGKIYGRVAPDDVNKIIEEYMAKDGGSVG
ncbi:MAG: NAD(P)H-dependent oxidoreductase subunit E [Clostridiales bacterium]|jgi:NADH:ubiquinone oxidoreductase subunit E|nr:NAD(P)H-dependent oxidoreductase subunit E [Clostridiales bacterium]